MNQNRLEEFPQAGFGYFKQANNGNLALSSILNTF
jgi:hypothetical protein